MIKQNKIKEAEIQLKKLAEANLLMGAPFPEWLDGKTGKLRTPKSYQGNQAWNAGMYILAYHSLKRKKCLI